MTHDILKHLSGSIYGPELNLVCPSCGSDYTYPQDFAVTDTYEILFGCQDCYDCFSLVIQQHKGASLLRMQKYKNANSWRRKTSPEVFDEPIID